MSMTLRDHMTLITRRGTNLDPSPAPVKKAPMTEAERKEKARLWAREHRKRQKAERDERRHGAPDTPAA